MKRIEKQSRRIIPALVGALLLVLLSAPTASAAPLYWNGHCYDLIDFDEPGGLTWDEAKAEAEASTHLGFSGYLATITSAAENAFITDNFLADAPRTHYWIGGYQPEGSPEPAGGWQWVTGEPFTYTNWAETEPNNVAPGEAILEIYADGAPRGAGTWNDEDGSDLTGYVIEYTVPEPATIALLAFAALGLFLGKRRSR